MSMNMRVLLLPSLFLLVGVVVLCNAGQDAPPYPPPPPDSYSSSKGNGSSGVTVVAWNYEYVKGPLLTSLFLMASGILKLGFHKMHLLSSLVPESCLLILVGVAFGAFLEAIGESELFQLHPRTFMLFLLPPIILDSAYSLVDRVFAENIGTILLFAVLGTIMSCFMLGPTLYGLAIGGGMNLDISLIECLLFASFIVAVDPVAVLAIFNEVGVNETLYFLVFGESLLNDAVTVVLYSMMKSFVEMDEIPLSQILIGIASFFTISLGGLCIGILFGVLTALLTRATKDLRVIEPLAVLILAYLSYIVAELFHWSGIISAIGCGIVQAQYAFHNISRKSLITVNYFIKMTSSTCDCMIFLYLGIEVLRNHHEWNTGFVLWSTFYCLVFRFVVIFGLSVFVNMAKPSNKINLEEQFIMWYGGLRGAVCFALCDTLNPKFRHRNMFLTTTFFIIFMTVFVQGTTIKPLVKLCKVKRKDKNESVLLIEEINSCVTDHIMTGVELISQQKGNFYVRNFLTNLNDNYLARWLQNNPMTQDQKILQTYGNMLMTDYERNVKKNYVYYKEPEVWSHFYADRPSEQDSYEGVVRRRPTSTTSRASSIRRSIMGKRPLENEAEPTCRDVHSMLKRTTSVTPALLHAYDPNLKNDDMRDIREQLEERHRRVERASRIRQISMNDGTSEEAVHNKKAYNVPKPTPNAPNAPKPTNPAPKPHMYTKNRSAQQPLLKTQHSSSEEGDKECISLSSMGSGRTDRNANVSYLTDGHHQLHASTSYDPRRHSGASTSRDRSHSHASAASRQDQNNTMSHDRGGDGDGGGGGSITPYDLPNTPRDLANTPRDVQNTPRDASTPRERRRESRDQVHENDVVSFESEASV